LDTGNGKERVNMNQVAIRTEAPVAPVLLKPLLPVLSLRADDSLNPLVERFLSSQDVKESSKRTYEKGLTRFMNWIREAGITRPTREDILAFKGYLEAQGLSSATLSTYLTGVRRFFEWTEGMKFYPNIAKGIKGGKRAKGFRKDPLTVNQARELLSGAGRETLEGKRNHALLNLLVRTGLRTIEAIRAEVGDIRQESGEAVLWIQGKGRDAKDEFCLLTSETLRPLNEYLQTRGRTETGDPLFTSLSDRNRNQRLTTRTIRGIVKRHLKGMGLDNERLTAHSLRHTAITLSLMGGATIQEAQALGRHANVNTTLIYAHNINRIAQAPERKIDALLAGVNGEILSERQG
jgi:integrase/recombinase XerD